MGYIAMCALSRAKNELAADDGSSMVVMPMRRALGLMVFVLAVAGCAAQGPYRRGEHAIEQFVADPALCPELKAPSSFRIPVAYLEIDEQGAFQDRSQVERALALVGEGRKPKYVVVFVHGWFHNAGADDPNVQRFKCALNNLQSIDDNAGEEVVGIYVGWRGESWSIPVVRYATARAVQAWSGVGLRRPRRPGKPGHRGDAHRAVLRRAERVHADAGSSTVARSAATPGDLVVPR